MRVAVLGESPADEAAIRILTQAILGREVTRIDGPLLRARGWPAARNVLPTVLKHLHYRTDAELLVVAVDCNSSPVHHSKGDGCRACELLGIAETTLQSLAPRHDGSTLRFAAGLAVPAIEAWYECGVNPAVSEAAWIQGINSGRAPYTKNELKELVYGTDRPNLTIESLRAAESATRLAADLGPLMTFFPRGFGMLAAAVAALGVQAQPC